MESDTKRPGGAAHVVGRLAFIRSLQTALNIHPSDSLGYNNNNNDHDDDELWLRIMPRLRFFPAAASCREDDLTIPSDPTLADPFFQEKLIDEQRKEKKAEVEK